MVTEHLAQLSSEKKSCRQFYLILTTGLAPSKLPTETKWVSLIFAMECLLVGVGMSVLFLNFPDLQSKISVAARLSPLKPPEMEGKVKNGNQIKMLTSISKQSYKTDYL